MNRERLEQLRRVIESVPEDRLHMRSVVEIAECGMAYCAAGWAACDPWFQAEGFVPAVVIVYKRGSEREILDASMDFFEAARFFGLSQEDTINLFGGELSPSTPKHAVGKEEILENIDRLLRGEPTRPYEWLVWAD